MSFSSEVKNELAKVKKKNEKAKLAELSALVRTTGSFSIVGLDKLAFSIYTENPAIARRSFELIKECFPDTDVKITVTKSSSKKVYILNVNYEDEANHILEKLGIISTELGYISFLDNIPKDLISSQYSKKAFLRGSFLGSGSINNPQKLYHLEFANTDEDTAKIISGILSSYNIGSKIIKRKNMNVLYVKDSNYISDILNIMGAHISLLEFESIRTKKEVKNLVNRQNNCENANINKIVATSKRQIDSINYIVAKKGWKYFPEELKQIAKLRKKYFDLDLTQIGKKHKPPMTKSAINYRLKKIEQIAEKLKEKLGEQEGNNEK